METKHEYIYQHAIQTIKEYLLSLDIYVLQPMRSYKCGHVLMQTSS
jgi:hypothetical protein